MNEIGWETLQNRRKKHRLVTFYKMTNGLTPQYLTNFKESTRSLEGDYVMKTILLGDNHLILRGGGAGTFWK